MLTALVLIGFVGAAIYRVTTPEERTQFLEQVVQPAAARMDEVVFAAEPFRAALRTRTPWLVVTPVLAGLQVLVFLAMVFGPGALDDPATLVAWGANHGPRTTNGEWWRLLTENFVQTGPFNLLFILIGFVQVSEMLERLVGPFLVGLVFVTAGVIGGLVSLSDHPLEVHAGGAAAVFGLYGLLLAVAVWRQLRPTGLSISVAGYQLLVPASLVFALYSLFTGDLVDRAALAGLMVGLIGGMALTIKIGERKPTRREMAIAKAVAGCLVATLAWPLRGIVDVRPELTSLVASEDREANMFRASIARFTTRQIPIDTRHLAGLIDRTILPQVREARARIEAMEGALPQHQPLVASAHEYLRLREASWQLRAEGFRKGKVTTLREAESLEQASLKALQRLRGL